MHRKIGILGGVSAESTRIYYEYITREYTRRFGDYGYPEMVIYSVSFQEFVSWHSSERWDLIADKMIAVFKALEKAGADFGLIAANTLHIVFDQVQRELSMPLLSIIEATAEAIEAKGVQSVGLLGTIVTMSRDFYRTGLGTRDICTLVPDLEGQEVVNRVIFEELTRGIINDGSREIFVKIINSLIERGAEGIVLGCTEIPLLIRAKDCDVPLFDTTRIHAEKALNYATT